MLEVANLCKTYPGAITALDDVSFGLQPGLFGLLGPNGAGKSTLMRTLATLQLPDSGTARLGDVDLINQPQRARELLGYLPQDVGVYPRVTAREMLRYLAGLKGLGRGRELDALAAQQLAKVNLSDAADQRLDTYSGGMRQRFGIAAALLGSPRLVIVDEPTAGLDPAERRRFQLLLTESARDCVLILSSHIVEDIAGLCSDMAIMNHGQIVARGAPDELLTRLQDRVWEFTTDLNSLESMQRSHRVLSWQPQRGRLRLRIWSEQRPAVPTDELAAVSPNLEDLYALLINQEL